MRSDGPDAHSDLTLAEFKAQQAGCFTDDGFDAIPVAPVDALQVAATAWDASPLPVRRSLLHIDAIGADRRRTALLD